MNRNEFILKVKILLAEKVKEGTLNLTADEVSNPPILFTPNEIGLSYTLGDLQDKIPHNIVIQIREFWNQVEDTNC